MENSTEFREQPRILALIRGEPDFVTAALHRLGDFVLDDTNIKALAKSHAHLGRGHSSAACSCLTGVNPDMLCSLAGLVRRGGALILGIRDLEALGDLRRFRDAEAIKYTSRDHLPPESLWLRRFRDLILSFPRLRILANDGDVEALAAELAALPREEDTDPEPELTGEIRRFCQDPALRVLLLSGPRGAGKSTRMARMVPELLRSGGRILVTGPCRENADLILSRCPGLTFRGLDDLPGDLTANDVLLADEAGSVPLGRLEDLLSLPCRLVISGTSEGYEGTGGGLRLKFAPHLDQLGIPWAECRLERSFRFDHDALFRLWQEIFLPGGTAPETSPQTGKQITAEPGKDSTPSGSSCPVADPDLPRDLRQSFTPPEEITAARLAQDEMLLREVFGLLCRSHYRTAPSDLRQLLDNPDSRLLAVRDLTGRTAGVIWMIREEMKESLVPQVFLNRRRPRGNLLPQTLAAHGGFRNAGYYRFLRVVRIAVDPLWQRRKLGTWLLDQAEELMEEEGTADFLGVSFGITGELAAFWSSAGFVPVRAGLRLDGATGLHSAVMLRTRGRLRGEVLREWHRSFVREFLLTASWQHRALDTGTVRILLSLSALREEPDPDYLRDLQSLSRGLRAPEQALWTVQRWLGQEAGRWTSLPLPAQDALISYFVQHRDPDTTARRQMLEEAVTSLRELMGATLDEFTGAGAHGEERSPEGS